MSQEEFNALKKSRSSLIGVVTRMRNRYNKTAQLSSSTYDIGAMTNHLASLDKTASNFRKTQEEICDFNPEFLEQEINIDAELEIAETFEENVEAIHSLVQRLIATRRAQRAATEFRSNLEDLEEATSSHILRDYSAAISTLTSSFKSLQTILNESTIDDDHSLRRDISHFQSRLNKLSSCEKVVLPTILSRDAPTSTRPKPVQLPKIHLPTFDGNLMNWSTFWSQFRAAVDSNRSYR